MLNLKSYGKPSLLIKTFKIRIFCSKIPFSCGHKGFFAHCKQERNSQFDRRLLINNILAGIFPIPDYLDKQVVNLLLHMLQVIRI